MKRKNNGIIVGSILVVLVGALIFLQARNQEPEEELPTAPPATPGATGPRVDEHLDQPNSMGRSPMPAPQ